MKQYIQVLIILSISIVFICDASFVFVYADTSIDNVTDINAIPGDNIITLQWTNPSDTNLAGVMIIKSTNNITWIPTNGIVYSYGENVDTDTNVVYYTTGSEYEDTDVINDINVHYKIFTVNYDVDYSTGSDDIVSAGSNEVIPPEDPNGSDGDSSDSGEDLGDDSGSDDDAGSDEQNLYPPLNLEGDSKHLSILLNWQNNFPNNLIGYNIYSQCEDNEFTKNNNQLILETSYLVENLIENEVCNFYVTGIDTDLIESVPSSIVNYTIIADNDAPTFLTGLEILTGNNQVTLDWNSSEDLDLLGYNIYLNNSLISQSPIKKAPFTISDLNNGSEYDIKIVAIDNNNNEGEGSTETFTPPDSNTNNNINLNSYLEDKDLSIELDENGQPMISWGSKFTSSENLAGFDLYRGENYDTFTKLNNGYLLSYPPFIDTTSISGRTYHYKLISKTTDGSTNKESGIHSITSQDASNAGYFNDVVPNHTFFEYVEKLRTHFIVQGYEGHIYKPNQNITRVEALKIIMKSAGVSPVDTLRFHDYHDVLNNMWFYKYIQTGSLQGIVRGYDDGYFRPNKNVSRIESLKMVMNGGSIFANKDITYNPFLDLNTTFWGTEYAMTGYQDKIINGYSDGNFRPNQPITRAEAAKIVSFLLK